MKNLFYGCLLLITYSAFSQGGTLGPYSPVLINDGSAGHVGELKFGLSDVIFKSNPLGQHVGDLQIKNWNTAGTGYNEALFIKHNGNIGIGTTSPLAKLSLVGNGNTTVLELDTEPSSSSILSYDRSSSTFKSMYLRGSDFRFAVNDQVKFLVDNAGYVGIGNTNPSSKLHISSSIERETFRLYKEGNTSNYLSLWQGVGGAAIDAIGTGRLWIGYDQPTELIINTNYDGSPSTGKVGIGTNAPAAKLHISSSIARETLRLYLNGNTSNYLNFWQGSGAAVIDPIGTGQLWLGYDQATSVILGTNNDGTPSSGVVSIGSSTINTAYKLSVNGSIRSKEVKVEAGWSDFVFEEDYDLRSLEEVETYIAENHHLPEIPSEAQVSANGINLGEMNAKLLQKIEELTLYLIEINKEVGALKEDNVALRNELTTLKNK